MPGVSVVGRRGGPPTGAVDRALDAVCFFDDYGIERLFDGPDVAVATTGYDAYPTTSFETQDAAVVLEGYLYDVDGDEVETHLRDVARWVRAGATAELSTWVGSRDGDFVVYVVEKHGGDVAVVTDAFGRLPVYRAAVGETTVISRELKFVRELAREVGDPVPIDDVGVAQTLLFGYRLGTRTLFAGVERVPPGSLLRVDADGRGDDAAVDRLHRFDFGSTTDAGRSVEENARALVSLFESACRQRAAIDDGDDGDRGQGDEAGDGSGGGDAIVALSGGLDSRAVAAGFDAVDATFTAATFAREDGSDADEVRAARAVADRLGVEWRQYGVSGSDAHRETLLETMQGMNDIRLSFLLDFFERIDGRRGATYVTGDGGDKAFPDLSPPTSFDSVDDLVGYVVSSNRVFGLEEAADVAGVSAERLRSSVSARLESYPEADLGARYVHFLVRERGMNWLVHGEDRNRYYYWSVSPFYSLPFFEYAMRCPDGQKRGNGLYRAFLSELAPTVLDVEYVNFGAPITSMEYRAKQFVYDALARHPDRRSKVVGLLRRVKGDPTVSAPEVARWIDRQVAGSRSVRRTLSAPAICRITGDPASYSEPAMYTLFTVTSILARCRDVVEDGT